METKTRYTMVNKRGEEIYHSNSFLGFIGSTILAQLLGGIMFLIFVAIISGIASFFN